MKKVLINTGLFLSMICLFVMTSMGVNAQTFNTETVKPINENTERSNNDNNLNGIGNVTINSDLSVENYKDPTNAAQNVVKTDVTIEGVFGKIITKVKEILSNGQLLALYLCIGGFIVSALSAGFGALGHRGYSTGIIAALVFSVAYTCIKFGPIIMEAISQWLVN